MGGAHIFAVTETAGNLSVLDPASPPAESIGELFYLTLGITAAIFILVQGLLLHLVIRFRHPGGKPNEPPQLYGSKPIEVAWTVVPALIVFVLFMVVIRTITDLRASPSRGPADVPTLQVRVVGHQWWWEYIYEEYEGQKLVDEAGQPIVTANELHVPIAGPGERRPTYLEMTSADVIHSFWVPRLAGKIDVFPIRTTQLWFEPRSAGLFLGQCAEFCGTQHANMRIRVIAQEPAEFAAWLANQRRPAVEDPAAAAGRKVFLSQACMNCHRIRGTPAAGTVGPDLTHVASRETLATFLRNDAETLRKWVINPQDLKPGCLMPAMNLSPTQVDEVVKYLESLK